MKRIFSIAVLLSGMFLWSQLFAQVDTKDKDTTRLSEPNAVSVQKDAVVKTSVGMTSKVAASDVKKIYDMQGKFSASIYKDGTIRDSQGRLLGKYSQKGEYFSPTGEKVGSVENGVVLDKEDKEFARIRDDGRIYNAEGKYIGIVADDGTVLNKQGVRLGSAPGVDRNIATLFFFYPKQTPLMDSRPPEQR